MLFLNFLIILLITICSTFLIAIAVDKYSKFDKFDLSDAQEYYKKKEMNKEFYSIFKSINDGKICSKSELLSAYSGGPFSKKTMTFIEFVESLYAWFVHSTDPFKNDEIQTFKNIVSPILEEERYKKPFIGIPANDKSSLEVIASLAKEKGIEDIIKPELDNLSNSIKKNQEQILKENKRNKIALRVSVWGLIITVISLVFAVATNFYLKNC